MKKTPPAITSLPPAPAEERHGRMLRYGIAMGIRLVCFGLCFVVQGWWVVLPLLGAAVLPAIAVVIANVGATSPGEDIVGPGVPELAAGRDAPRADSEDRA